MEGHGALREVEYLVRDDEPLGETDKHIDEARDYAIGVLRQHFRETPRVYVSGHNFIYYAEGDPKTVVSPDAYVVRGVEQRQRDTFKVWEEGGHKPCFVLEVTSKSTRQRDLGVKMFRYRDDLRVGEYFLFDVFGEWIPEHLRGFRLASPGFYEPLVPDARGGSPAPSSGSSSALRTSIFGSTCQARRGPSPRCGSGRSRSTSGQSGSTSGRSRPRRS